MQFADLTIVESSVDQLRQSRVNTFTTWGQPLGYNEDEWVSRFEALDKGAWAEGDRYHSWSLVPRSDPGTLDILAHCETYRRPSLIGTKQPRSGLSYGIAGVFTPHRHRAHGYARQLLRLLHYIIAPTEGLPPFPTHWGAPPVVTGFKDASFSVLYSGVGDKYYASCRRGDGERSEPGWEREKVTSRTWAVPSGSKDESGDFIGYDDLPQYEARATAMMKSEFGKRDDGPKVAILPEENLFQLGARRYLLSPAYKSLPSRHFGLVLKPRSEGDPSPYIIYTFAEGLKDSHTLEILHVQQPFPFEAVLAAARAEGCKEVKTWMKTGDWDDHKPELDHDSEMPCIVVYDGKTSQTKWQWVEQYTWC